jgi:hypothetical protein
VTWENASSIINSSETLLKNGQFYSKCAKLDTKKNTVQNDFLTEQLLLVSLTRREETVLPVRVRACKNADTAVSVADTYKLFALTQCKNTWLSTAHRMSTA